MRTNLYYSKRFSSTKDAHLFCILFWTTTARNNKTTQHGNFHSGGLQACICFLPGFASCITKVDSHRGLLLSIMYHSAGCLEEREDRLSFLSMICTQEFSRFSDGRFGERLYSTLSFIPLPGKSTLLSGSVDIGRDRSGVFHCFCVRAPELGSGIGMRGCELVQHFVQVAITLSQIIEHA